MSDLGMAATATALAPNHKRKTPEEILDWFRPLLCKRLGVAEQDLDPDAEFAEFGLDSVNSVGLAGHLQQWLEIELPATLLYDYPTANRLVRHLSALTDGSRTEQARRSWDTDLAIEKAGALPDSALNEFYRRAFPTRSAWMVRNWRWLYRVGDFPGIEPVVAVKGKPVGFVGLTPFAFARNGKRETGIWATNFVVFREAAGSPLAITQFPAALNDMCSHKLGVGNSSSFELMTQAVKWAPKGGIVRCALALNPGAVAANRTAPMFQAIARAATPAYRAMLRARLAAAPKLQPEGMPASARDLAFLFDQGGKPGLIRDEAWVRWRFLDSPFASEYRLFRYQDTGAIVRCFRHGNLNRAHILWVKPTGNIGLNRKMFAGIARWAVGAGVDILWTVLGSEELLRASRSILRSRAPMQAMTHSLDASAQSWLGSGECELQCVDGDFDLSMLSE